MRRANLLIMENTQGQLTELLKSINPEWFYVISINKGYITLQGCYTSDKAKQMSRLAKLTVNDSGYIEGEYAYKDIMVKIVLT